MNVEIIIWNSNEGQPLEWIKDKILYNLAFVFGKGLLYNAGNSFTSGFLSGVPKRYIEGSLNSRVFLKKKKGFLKSSLKFFWSKSLKNTCEVVHF